MGRHLLRLGWNTLRKGAEQFEDSSLWGCGVDVDGVPLDHVNNVNGPTSLGLIEKQGQKSLKAHEVGLEKNCFDDSIALMIGPLVNPAHRAQPEIDLDVGDPLLICDVGLQVGWPFVSKPESVSGKDLDTGDKVARDSRGKQIGEESLAPVKLSKVNFKDKSAVPTIDPLDGFLWQFIAGGWAFVPVLAQEDAGGRSGTDLMSEGDEGSDERPTDDVSLGVKVESDDLASEFERNLRELLPGLQGGLEASGQRQATGLRKSERSKKPSSRFTEDAGYLTEPPKLTKKKGTVTEEVQGTSSKPLLISDWSNVQIASYCNACGISFTESVDACVNHIRSLELSRSMISKGLVATPSGGCGN